MFLYRIRIGLQVFHYHNRTLSEIVWVLYHLLIYKMGSGGNVPIALKQNISLAAPLPVPKTPFDFYELSVIFLLRKDLNTLESGRGQSFAPLGEEGRE